MPYPAITGAHGANAHLIWKKASRRIGRRGPDYSRLQTKPLLTCSASCLLALLNALCGHNWPECPTSRGLTVSVRRLWPRPAGPGVWGNQGNVPLWSFGTRLLGG